MTAELAWITNTVTRPPCWWSRRCWHKRLHPADPRRGWSQTPARHWAGTGNARPAGAALHSPPEGGAQEVWRFTRHEIDLQMFSVSLGRVNQQWHLLEWMAPKCWWLTPNIYLRFNCKYCNSVMFTIVWLDFYTSGGEEYWASFASVAP